MTSGWNNCYIYAIRHNKTGRVYIGCTTTDSRVRTHLQSLKNGKHKNELLQKDCNEYGYDFTAYLLEILNRDQQKHIDPHEREAYWIHYYGTDDAAKGYNSPKWYTRIDIKNFPVIKRTADFQVDVK